MKRFRVLFIAVNFILSAWFIDVWLTPNPGSRVIPVITLFESGSLRIDPYESYTLDKSLINGHYYSDKAPLSTMIMVPFYGLIKLLRIDRLAPDRYPAFSAAFTDRHQPVYNDSFVFPAYSAYVTGSLVCGTIPFVVILMLTFAAVGRNSGGVSPVLVTCLPFYGSFLFVYSGACFGHLLAGLFLLAGYIMIRNRQGYFAAGLFTGLAFLTEYPLGLALPIWLVGILTHERSWRKAFRFAAGFLPGLPLNALYVYSITGQWLTMPYSRVSYEGFAPMRENLGFGWPDPSAMMHLLVTPYRGLLLYAPFLILAGVVLVKSRPKRPRSWLTGYLPLLGIGYVLLMSSYYMWDGGHAFGPRHLIPVAVLLIYEGVVLVAGRNVSRLWFFTLTGTGLGLAWLAKATVVFNAPSGMPNPIVSLVIPEFMAGRLNPNNILTMALGVSPVVGIGAWPLAFVCLMGLLNRSYNKCVMNNRVQECRR